MAAIDFINLSVSYGDGIQPVIESFSCSIPSGTTAALVGPSGCGKSSLLSSVNRMSDLVRGCKIEGDVCVGGQSVFDSRIDPIELRRKVGMVFQQPTPFPISIAKNMLIPLRELGLATQESHERMESALIAAGLWEEVNHRLSHPAMELSGGQQQRLCIARALALEPQVLLLDEPCSALDQAAAERVEETLLSLSGDVTILIATHNLEQAKRLSQQTIDLGTCSRNPSRN